MPSNAFARTNAAKLVALPQYLVGDLLSRIVPRRPDHWVVGSAFGVHDGALLGFLWLIDADGSVTAVLFVDGPVHAGGVHGLGESVDPALLVPPVAAHPGGSSGMACFVRARHVDVGVDAGLSSHGRPTPR